MSVLFKQGKIKSMNLKNRFVRSATVDNLVDDNGKLTEDYLDLYENLAKGNVGLIITNSYFISHDGTLVPRAKVIASDCEIEDIKRVADIVHKYDSKIVVQINHVGGQPYGKVHDSYLAPSSVRDLATGIKPRQMIEAEIEDAISGFAEAARRVKMAGFDGVQIHGAHGFLVTQFLSPYFNRRTDKWGGSFENRQRFLIEVYNRIRKTVGSDFPVLIKINGDDLLRSGMSINETVEVCKKLESIGIDAIEVSSSIKVSQLYDVFAYGKNEFRFMDGGGNSLMKPLSSSLKPFLKPKLEKENYNLKFAAEIKKAVKIPVISVGGFRKVVDMEKALNEDKCDFISMCRPFIAEPEIINLIKSGKKASSCTTCGKCSIDIMYNLKPFDCPIRNKKLKSDISY
ncbi:NADH:flavin oxidoreductase [Acidaminobacter sp. JC074]|uniref:NADH:flavin oxidoreductase n=1 Tax=Acidaminobacter sp. JC074 TaxID=2530199 RepID=UPI001F117207|nr:NADH:flavin oxidoreductase [Acidaminobacter sp. JC074]MCH4886408.1 NADH:flavin oxidoreductase [Acidaminobacter sp. JC074]